MEVRRGEWLSVIGHNGSGKSTLAKLFNGLVIPGRGTVTVDRFSTADEEPVRLVQVNRAFALRDPTRAGFTVTFTSAGDRYPWGAVPVTNLIIAVDTRADLEYAPTEHVLDYFPPG